jgi:prolyl-tRNA synthetase
VRILADHALKGRRNMIAGANRDDYHFKNVTPDEDFHPQYFDLRQTAAGDVCSRCSGTLNIARATEIGRTSVTSSREWRMCWHHIVLDCILWSAVELYRDKDGIRLPVAIAPFRAVITPVNYAEPAQHAAADQLYNECLRLGVDVLLDDRDERPGVKFKDADLIGIPYRVTIGRKLVEGRVEFAERGTHATEEIALADAAARISAAR